MKTIIKLFYKGFIFNLMTATDSWRGLCFRPLILRTILSGPGTRAPLAIQKWHGQNTSPLVGLRHPEVVIWNFSLIRSQRITGILFRTLFMQMKIFFPAHRFFQFFQQVITPNWHTAVWTADISSSCWLVGVGLFFIYIYTHTYIYTYESGWAGILFDLPGNEQ